MTPRPRGSHAGGSDCRTRKRPRASRNARRSVRRPTQRRPPAARCPIHEVMLSAIGRSIPWILPVPSTRKKAWMVSDSRNGMRKQAKPFRKADGVGFLPPERLSPLPVFKSGKATPGTYFRRDTSPCPAAAARIPTVPTVVSSKSGATRVRNRSSIRRRSTDRSTAMAIAADSPGPSLGSESGTGLILDSDPRREVRGPLANSTGRSAVPAPLPVPSQRSASRPRLAASRPPAPGHAVSVVVASSKVSTRKGRVDLHTAGIRLSNAGHGGAV